MVNNGRILNGNMIFFDLLRIDFVHDHGFLWQIGQPRLYLSGSSKADGWWKGRRGALKGCEKGRRITEGQLFFFVGIRMLYYHIFI